jgi:hypothetical protein
MADTPGFEDEPAPDMGALLAELKARGLDPDAEDLALALPAILVVKRMEREVCHEFHPPGAPDGT